MSGGLLTKRALMLLKVETTPGVDANPSASTDAFLVEEPEWTSDPQMLERNFVSNDLSKFEHLIGRVIAGFKCVSELRGNGLQHSGNVSDAPMIAKALQGCGYVLSAMTGAGSTNLSDIIADRSNAGTVKPTWAKGGTITVDSPVLYTIEVTTAGASGVAEVIITGNNDEEDDLSGATEETITSASPLSLGSSGATITPTFSGSLTLGDKWHVMVFPTGVMAKPVSENFKTVTCQLYMDGLLHEGYAGMGNFSIEAQAGEIAKVTFNFTTTFVEPADAAMPASPVYETTLPPQVELSLLTWGGKKDLYAESWSFDAGNEINARMDVNAPQGYLGSRISDRTPVGGFSPEAQLEADAGFWEEFHNGTSKVFTARVGKTRGNMVVLFAPTAQTSEQSYTDRNGLRALDKSIGFKRGNTGNDEMIFVFC